MYLSTSSRRARRVFVRAATPLALLPLAALPILSFVSNATAQMEDESDAFSEAEEQEGSSDAEPIDEADESAETEVEEDFESSLASEGEAEGGDELTVSEGGGLFASAAAGEDIGAGDDVSSSGGSDFSLDWGGYVRGDAFIGKLPNTAGFEPGINAAYAEVSLQPRVTAGSWGSAFVDFRVRYGQQLDTMDLFIDLREAYASAYLGPVEIRMGKQVVVWGRADAFNPTSNIAPVDFRVRSPIEDDRRLGTVGARAFLNLSPVTIEGVWMPLYQPTIYPPLDLQPYVRFVDPYYPSLSIRNSLIAGKVDLELSAFEASVSYLFGNAPLPGIDLATNPPDPNLDPGYTVSATEPNEVRVRRRSYRQHVIGADIAATPFNLFGFRAEAAYRLPEFYDPQARPWTAKPDLQWVVGLDKEFGPVMIIAQYLGRYTFDWEYVSPPPDNSQEFLDLTNPNLAQPGINTNLRYTNQMLFSQLHELQSLISGRIEWTTLHDSLSISALGLVNLNTKEWLVTPKIAYDITGGLTAYLGAEIYSGPPDTLFDAIDQTLTAGYAELRMSF